MGQRADRGEWSDWYRREDPEQWVLPRILRARAAEHPDRPYYRFQHGPWVSYAEMLGRSNRVANALGARGIGPGDTVSVMLSNTP